MTDKVDTKSKDCALGKKLTRQQQKDREELIADVKWVMYFLIGFLTGCGILGLWAMYP